MTGVTFADGETRSETMEDESHTGRHQLDHVVVVVDDLDTAAGALEDVGFYVTARSDHPYGTSNRLVTLDDSYIELMAVTDRSAVPESGFARFVMESLDAGRRGPRLIAFRTDDAEAARERLLDEGLNVPETLRFGREASLANGETVSVEFAVVIPDLDGLVVGGMCCQHLTPEKVWHPSTLDHPNGAGRLVAVSLPDAGPGGWERLAILAGASSGPPLDAAGVSVVEEPARLVVEAAEGARASVEGTAVEVVTAP